MRMNFCILMMALMLCSISFAAPSVTYGANQTAIVRIGALKIADVQLLTPIVNDEFITCEQFRCYLEFDIVPAISFVGNSSLRFDGTYANSRYSTISFKGTEIYAVKTIYDEIPTFQYTLHSSNANGTWNYWNTSVQDGIRYNYRNISAWQDFNPSSFSYAAGQHYRIRQVYSRSISDDYVDLIPSLFGVQFTAWGWWNSSWPYVEQVCFTSGATSTLTNFPARAEINTSNATLFAAGNCSNVRFISTDNTTTLKYDIDDIGFCNSSVYNMTYYVQIPSFTSSAYCANLYMGNLGASSGRDSSMWLDAGYSRVMHFAAGTGCGNDSVYGTNYANFTCGLQQPMAAWTKSYVQITSGAYNAHFISPPTAASGTFGESALVITNATSSMTIAGSYTSDYKGGGGLTAQWDCSANKFGWSWSGGVNVPVCDSLSFSTNTWYYLGGMRNSVTNASFYRAGAYITGSASNTGSTATTPDLALGNSNPSQYAWSGYFDEVRVHNTSRTDDWFKAEYGQTWAVSSITAFIPEPDGMLQCFLPLFIPSGYSNSIQVSCQKINSSHMPQTAAVINCSALSSAFVERQSASSMTEQAGRFYTWSLTLSNLPEGDCNFINCTSTSNGSIIGWGGQMCRERDIVYQVWQSANRSTSNLSSSDIPSAIAMAYQVWQNANRSTSNSTATSTLAIGDIPTAVQNAYQVWQNENRSISNLTTGDIPTAALIAYTTWENANRSTSNLTDIQAAYQVWQSANRSTSNLTSADIPTLVQIAYAVWQNANRSTSNSTATSTLTAADIPTLVQIAYAVWQSDNRSTSNLTAAEIWSAAARTLTTTEFLTALEQAQLANANSTGNLTAADVWGYANKALTNYNETYISYLVWQNGNRTFNLSAQDVWEYKNRTLNTTEFLTILEQEQLLNASTMIVNPNITVNFTFNNTYNQTSLVSDINASIQDTYNVASVQATNVSTDLIFNVIFCLLAISLALIALIYQRTMLWIISGCLWIGLGFMLLPLNTIIFICCVGIGFYLWARVFMS